MSLNSNNSSRLNHKTTVVPVVTYLHIQLYLHHQKVLLKALCF